MRCQGLRREPAEVRAAVVGHGQPEPLVCPGPVAQALARLRRPVEPGGPVVRTRERDGGAFEHVRRLRVPAQAKCPPPDLPLGPRRVAARREPRCEFPVDGVGLVVLVVDRVHRRQAVERVFRPGALGERLDKGPRQRDVLVSPAGGAGRHQVEVARLGPPRRTLEPGFQILPHLLVAAQEVVALGEAQAHQFRGIAIDQAGDALEGLAGRSVAPLLKQAFAAGHFPSQAGAPRNERGHLGGRHLPLRGLCRLGSRPLVVERFVCADRTRPVTGARSGPGKAQQHLVGGVGLPGQQLVVQRHGRRMVAERRVHLGQLQRGRLGQVPRRGRRAEPGEGRAGGFVPLEAEFGQTGQVGGVRGERGRRQRGRAHERKGLGRLLVADERRRPRQRSRCRHDIGRRGRPAGRGNQPILGQAGRQRRMDRRDGLGGERRVLVRRNPAGPGGRGDRRCREDERDAEEDAGEGARTAAAPHAGPSRDSSPFASVRTSSCSK